MVEWIVAHTPGVDTSVNAACKSANIIGSFNAQVAEISVSQGQLRVHRVVCAVDCGQVVNPRGVEQQIQSGIVFGLTAALKGSITLDRGRVQQ
jgi:isoquinoline 1-oxidoreductase beta subunit